MAVIYELDNCNVCTCGGPQMLTDEHKEAT